jgi:hypothetical protein
VALLIPSPVQAEIEFLSSAVSLRHYFDSTMISMSRPSTSSFALVVWSSFVPHARTKLQYDLFPVRILFSPLNSAPDVRGLVLTCS